MTVAWTLDERSQALTRAERDGVELLVVGGGITGAGVLRDAASRGLRTCLLERDDFAGGTSSRSSKLIHGGLRYIGEGQLSLTRTACRERDLLTALNPHLVQPIPFLFPAYRGGKVPYWQVRGALTVYSALANFRKSSRFQMLTPKDVAEYSRDIACDQLRGAGLYWDGQVDDARLVIETLRSARRLGGEAIHHAEVQAFLHNEQGRIIGVRLHDRLANRTLSIRADRIINAAGPSVERIRGLDRRVLQPELRPAKGVHVVIPRSRVHAEGAVTFEAPDGRHLFFIPWDEVALLGTTDTFSHEIDEPTVRIEEVHYVLAAANQAFPRAALTTNDIRSVFAGVRPLVASASAETPPSQVSREHRIYDDPSGLISLAGGKLTTYRDSAEKMVDRVVRDLPKARRQTLRRSQTRSLPLREDSFDRIELEQVITERFGIHPRRAEFLARTYGVDAEALLAEADASAREPIGESRFTYAEISWLFRTECPANLCDLLERRLRMAIFAVGQGLPELDRIAATAGAAAGWDRERIRAEAIAYATSVQRRYQIVAPETQAAASAA